MYHFEGINNYKIEISIYKSFEKFLFLSNFHLFVKRGKNIYVFDRFVVSGAWIATIDEESRADSARLSKRGRLLFRDSVVRASGEARPVRDHGIIGFGDIEEGDRPGNGDGTVQVLRLKSRSVQGRSYLNFTCFCFHPVSYSVFLELSQTTVEPVGELFPFRARLSDRVLGRGSRGPTRLQDREEQAETSEEGHVSPLEQSFPRFFLLLHFILDGIFRRLF